MKNSNSSYKKSLIMKGIYTSPKFFTFWILLFMFFYISNAQLPLIRPSPIVYFTAGTLILILFYRKKLLFIFNHIIKWPILLYFTLLIVNFVVRCFVAKKLSFSIIELSMLCIACIIILYSTTQTKFNEIFNIYVAILISSMTVFLSSIYFPSFQNLVSGLFPGEIFLPRGLARAPHILGYQLTTLWIFFFVNFYFKMNIIYRLVNVIGLLFCSFALYIQGMRSGLIGIIIAISILLFVSRRKLRVLFFTFLIFISLLVIFNRYVGDIPNVDFYSRRGHLLYRLFEEQDMPIRMDLQVEAIKLLIKYPFGLPHTEVRWEDHIRSTFSFFYQNRVISVHNAFLGFALNNGLLPGFALLILACFGLQMAYKCLKVAFSIKNIALPYYILPLVYIGDIINALFHNATFINEPSCAIVFFLLFAQYSLCLRNYRHILEAYASNKK